MGNVMSGISAFAVTLLLSRWFWGLLITGAVLLLLVIWYRRKKLRTMEKLEYERSFSADGVFAGDSFRMTETLYNPTFFPLLAVKMELYMPAGFRVDHIVCTSYTKITSIFYIPPRARVTKEYTVRADLRGHYRMETALIRYRKNEILFQAPIQIYVYPAYTALRADVPPDLYHAGNRISKAKYLEDPFFLAGIRPYMHGDPLRSVNFKASVRSFSGGMRRLMSNEYDSSRNYDAMIVLDLFAYADNGSGEEQRAQLERGLCYASYLLYEILRNGGAAGFTVNCAEDGKRYTLIECGTGKAHAEQILQCMARIDYFSRREYSVTPLLERFAQQKGSSEDVYLITPVVDDGCARAIRHLEARGRNVCVIPLRTRRGAV